MMVYPEEQSIHFSSLAPALYDDVDYGGKSFFIFEFLWMGVWGL
jgi:hypothetical protein